MLVNGRYVSIDGISRPFVKASVLLSIWGVDGRSLSS